MTISAGLGIANFPFTDAAQFWQWVDLCDSGGVDSLWQSDRLISQDNHLECISTMAALAGRTRHLKFGMNVASMGLRNPVQTAKACATIDFLSDGRLLPAFGVGSPRTSDYSASGIPTAGRGGRATEGVAIMSQLWAEPSVDFAGKHFHLHGASIAPRPVQQPLPLWLGGSAAGAIERTAQWGTGWQAGIETPAQVAPVVAAIKARTAELGRTIDEDHYGAGFAFRFGSSTDAVAQSYARFIEKVMGQPAAGYMAVGDTEDILGLMRAFHGAGIHKFILRPLGTDGSDVIAQTRLFVERLLPALKQNGLAQS